MRLTEKQQQFADENHRLILKFLRQYQLDFTEWYDIIALGYLNAVLHFDEERGAFSTLAYCAMKRAWVTELCRQKRQKRKGNIFSLNEMAFPETGATELLELLPTEEQIEEDTIFLLDLWEKSRHLRPRQREILRMRAAGMLQCEIAEKFGVNQASISQSLKRIRDYLFEREGVKQVSRCYCRKKAKHVKR